MPTMLLLEVSKCKVGRTPQTGLLVRLPVVVCYPQLLW